MAYKVEVDYTGRESYIFEAPGREEAAEKAVELFEQKNPGLIVTGTHVETLTAIDRRELNHADEL